MSHKKDNKNIRDQFPILHQQINNYPLIYLDNAATTQKPDMVTAAMRHYYQHTNSNVHRGVHTLSQRATAAFENARKAVQDHLNAAHDHEIIFTRGTTESINLVANSFGDKYIGQGDEILISALEHHSNIVPWQMLAERKQAKVKVLPANRKGELILDKLDEMVTAKTRIIAVNHVSNTLGTVNPVKEIIEKAHAKNIPVLIDGAQAVPHMDVDVQELDADFYCFSAHKMYGPMGIGAVYGKEKWLEEIPPWQGGGEMIKQVTFEKTTYNELPYKFEAGTPNVAGAIGMHKALEFMDSIGKANIRKMENELLAYATEKLRGIEGLTIYGQAQHKAPVVSFLLDGIHPFDAGTIIDKLGIAVRTGHHCTQPLMNFFEISGTVRASFAVYNNMREIDALTNAIEQAKKMLA
ncbi:MAG: cysteine desulfurase [Bacteroidales bacterium]